MPVITRLHRLGAGAALVAAVFAGQLPAWANDGTSSAAADGQGVPGALRVYPLGDSITYGVGFPRSTPGGYRSVLDSMLSRDGIAHRFLGSQVRNSSPTLDRGEQQHHEGHSGYRIDQIGRGLIGRSGGPSDSGGRWLLGTATRSPIVPDVVLVHLGTNDLLQDYDPDTRYDTPSGRADLSDPAQRQIFIAHLTARLGALLDALHAYRPRAFLVVATILPIGSQFCDQATPEFAAAVTALVAAERAAHRPVALADAFGAFTVTSSGRCLIRPGLLSDTVHPTTAGYAALAGTFEQALRGVLAGPPHAQVASQAGSWRRLPEGKL